jgi:hypothetical protein
MLDFLFWAAVGFAVATVFASFFEWSLHRFVMHRPVGRFVYAYRAHTLTHHRVFRADHTYHLRHEADKEQVPMAWWNGPVLIAACQIPFVLAGWFSGHFAVEWGALAACIFYYAAYEYLHWCMHIPRKRHVERSGLFFRLNGHHLLHHRYMRKNFNVVLPLADLILGTLMLRSKVRFAQAVGPTVPNVQPKEKLLRRCTAGSVNLAQSP